MKDNSTDIGKEFLGEWRKVRNSNMPLAALFLLSMSCVLISIPLADWILQIELLVLLLLHLIVLPSIIRICKNEYYSERIFIKRRLALSTTADRISEILTQNGMRCYGRKEEVNPVRVSFEVLNRIGITVQRDVEIHRQGFRFNWNSGSLVRVIPGIRSNVTFVDEIKLLIGDALIEEIVYELERETKADELLKEADAAKERLTPAKIDGDNEY